MPIIKDDNLRAFFDAQDEVILAYLFGSVATGREHPMSDVDIGVLFSEHVPYEAYPDVQVHLIVALPPIVGAEDIDVVILNEATPLLNYEVIRTGKRLFVRDERLRIAFEVKTMREYFDTAYLRAVNRFYLKRHVKERFYGFRSGECLFENRENAGGAKISEELSSDVLS